MALTLNKQTVNFVLDQGATFEKTITAKNTAGGNVTISSGTTSSKLRQSTYSGNNIHTFSTSTSGKNFSSSTIDARAKYLSFSSETTGLTTELKVVVYLWFFIFLKVSIMGRYCVINCFFTSL